MIKLCLQGVSPRMVLGLRDRRIVGARCKNISVFSRVKGGFILVIWCVSVPRCIVVNMWRESRAVISM